MNNNEIVFFATGTAHDRAVHDMNIDLIAYDFRKLLPAGARDAIRVAYAREPQVITTGWNRLLDGMFGPGTPFVNRLADRMLLTLRAGTTAVVTTHPLAALLLGRLRLHGRLTVPVAAISAGPVRVIDGIDLHLAGGDPTGTASALAAMIAISSMPDLVTPRRVLAAA